MSVPYDLRPTEAELSEARALVGVALDRCERNDLLDDPLETPPRVALGWTDSRPVREERQGVSGTTFAGAEVELAYNADVSGWTDAIGPVVAQQYARAWFDERVDGAFRWQHLLREAFADQYVTRTYPDGPFPWRTVDEEVRSERWRAIRGELGQRDDLPEDRATMGVAAALGEQLTSEASLSVVVDRDREAVATAGDAAFQ